MLNYGTDIYRRTNLLSKVNVAVNKWIDFNFESRLSNSVREFPTMGPGEDYFQMFLHISRAYPFTPVYDGWGNYLWESHIPRIQNGGTDRTKTMDMWNNFKTVLRPAKGWNINLEFAHNYMGAIRSDNQKEVYIHNVDQTTSVVGFTVPNHIERGHTNNVYWSTNLYSSYDLKLNKHQFSILGGMQLERGRNNYLTGFRSDLINSDVPSIQTGTGTTLVSESVTQRATAGYFGRLTYNMDDRYLFEANVRHDGSYVFREGKRWGTFPSFSAGWNIHNENFWFANAINTLKLRASWGQLGNQQVSPYSDLELIPLQTGRLDWIYGYGERRPTGYTTAPNIVNSDLTWETASMTNLGLNATFLKNRLAVDFDIYERNTRDMIGPSQALPGVLGTEVPRANNASLQTRGWELALKWNHQINRNLSYFVQFNLYDYKSKVTKYYNPTGTLSTWYEGAEVGEIWGYQVNDLFRSQAELDDYLSKKDISFFSSAWNPGDVRYEDLNGDGKVNNGRNTITDHGDMFRIGNQNPRYQMGASLGLNYKGFELSMLWRGVLKREIYYNTTSHIFWGFNSAWFISTVTPDHLDYYRDSPGDKYVGLYEGDANINTDGYWPRPYLSGSDESKNKNYANTRYLQKANYIRLQNLQLAYNLPASMISKLKLQRVRMYLSGENLLTISKLPRGIDPVGTSEFGRLTYGADRIISFGLNITY